MEACVKKTKEILRWGSCALALTLWTATASAQCVPCYGTFGLNLNAFVSNSVWCVNGTGTQNCGPSNIRQIAAPFSVNATGPLVGVTLALQYYSGSNGVIVSLAKDSGNGPGPNAAPGNVIESWTVENLPVSLMPPVLTILPDNLNVTLQAGQEYWLILQPIAPDTLVGWYRTVEAGVNGDVSGTNNYPAMANSGTSWTPLIPDGITGTQPAFEVGGWQTGTLAHFAAGGGWTMAITVSNPTSAAESVEVLPFDESANYISSANGVSATQTQGGVTSAWNIGSVLILQGKQSITLTLTGGTSTVVGSVAVSATGAVTGYGVFHWAGSPGASPSDGTVRLQTEPAHSITLPYDNSTGYVTGVALATQLITFNPVQSMFPGTVAIKAVVLDDQGNQLDVLTFTLKAGGHTSFVMPTASPASSGRRGVVIIYEPERQYFCGGVAMDGERRNAGDVHGCAREHRGADALKSASAEVIPRLTPGVVSSQSPHERAALKSRDARAKAPKEPPTRFHDAAFSRWPQAQCVLESGQPSLGACCLRSR